MSLILDALKKANEERGDTANSAPLDTNYDADVTTQKDKSAPWLITAIALLVIVSGFIAWLIWPSSNNNSPIQMPRELITIEQASPIADPIATAIATPTPTITVEPATLTTTADEKRQALINKQYSSEPDNKEDHQTEIAKLYESDPEKSDTNNTATTISTRSLSESNAKVEPKTQTAKIATTPKPANTIINKENTLAFFSSVYLIKGLPFSTQETIPTLMYAQHNYVASGNSTVVLNGKVYRENSSVADGIVLIKIVEDGIVLKKDNTQFKMPALSSWLNY